MKLIHKLPSQVLFPRFFTIPGKSFVSSSSTLCNIPSLLRKPITILGTPSRKDWTQNLSNFRSNFSLSLSFWISADVLSSTQLTGLSCPPVGLQSHTDHYTKSGRTIFMILKGFEDADLHPLRLQLSFSIFRSQFSQPSSTGHNCSRSSLHVSRWSPETWSPIHLVSEKEFQICSLTSYERLRYKSAAP